MTQETTELLLTNARFRNAMISLFPIREQAIWKVVFYLLKHKDCNHCIVIIEKLLAQKCNLKLEHTRNAIKFLRDNSLLIKINQNLFKLTIPNKIDLKSNEV